MPSERFDRQSALFSDSEQDILGGSCVAVIGCGGLGSQVVVNLVSAGIGRFVIADPDVVCESNLNRQFVHFGHLDHHKVDSMEEWILGADSSAEVRKCRCAVDAGNADSVISDADVVVDCLDNVASRYVLAQSCRRMGKVLVHGGVDGRYGQVSVFGPGTVPRLEDILRPVEEGAHISYSPSVSVIGALEADQAVAVLLGHETLEGSILTVDMETFAMERHSLRPGSDIL